MKTALYNEIDPFAAAWLRELIKEGVIADGEVAEKDMWDVLPNELDAYRQVHLCAGIGGWSAALRLAGWPDDRPVWTVSLPCQPFSAAGKGAGLVDERGQLADAFLWLAGVCKPEFIFGEQVEAAIKHNWWDIVASSLETIGYAVGSVSFPASSIGAFHIRQRLYWVADGSLHRLPRTEPQCDNQEDERRRRCNAIEPCESYFQWMADSDSGRAWRYGKDDPESDGWKDTNDIESGSEACELAESGCLRSHEGASGRNNSEKSQRINQIRIGVKGCGNACELGNSGGAGSQIFTERRCLRREQASRPGSELDNFWSDAEWIACRDGKARPVKPGIFPLAYGISNRVGTLRGAGNAIVPQAAAEFIKVFCSIKNIKLGS